MGTETERGNIFHPTWRSTYIVQELELFVHLGYEIYVVTGHYNFPQPMPDIAVDYGHWITFWKGKWWRTRTPKAWCESFQGCLLVIELRRHATVVKQFVIKLCWVRSVKFESMACTFSWMAVFRRPSFGMATGSRSSGSKTCSTSWGTSRIKAQTSR